METIDYELLEEKFGKINKKQEAFCIYLLSGLSATESYIRAYDVSKEKYASAAAAACRLRKMPSIKNFLNYEKARQLRELREDLNPAIIIREMLNEALSKSDENKASKMKALEIMFNALNLPQDLLEQIVATETFYIMQLADKVVNEESREILKS